MVHYHAKPDGLSAEEVSQYELAAIAQDMVILKYIKSKPDNTEFTSKYLESIHVLGKKTPYSSYVRAVSNLRTAGFITSKRKVKGKFGRIVNSYILTEKGRLKE
jgi:DNA-binding PadR family transcriptional regulator